MAEEAKTKARELVDALLPFAEQGIAIVGLEPSCLLTLRDEALVMGLGEAAETISSQALLFGQTLLNVRAVLEAGGAGPEHMVRMTWYVLDRVEYNARLKELGAAYREVMGRNFPAMTCVQVAALIEARAKVEIEVTAVLGD